MQETFNPENFEHFREFFETKESETESQMIQRMDDRAEQLNRERGHTVVKRAKIGRNEPCPCGSGAKFKKCCIGEIRR